MLQTIVIGAGVAAIVLVIVIIIAIVVALLRRAGKEMVFTSTTNNIQLCCRKIQTHQGEWVSLSVVELAFVVTSCFFQMSSRDNEMIDGYSHFDFNKPPENVRLVGKLKGALGDLACYRCHLSPYYYGMCTHKQGTSGTPVVDPRIEDEYSVLQRQSGPQQEVF